MIDYKLERTDGEFILRFPKETLAQVVQDRLDYFEFIRIAAMSKATQTDVDQLVEDVKQHYWDKNKDRFEGLAPEPQGE